MQGALSALKDGWNSADDARKRELSAAVRRLQLDRMPDGFGAGLLGPFNASNLFPKLRIIGDGCLNCTGIPYLELPSTLQRIGSRFANDAKEARKEMIAIKASAPTNTAQLVRHGVLKSLEKLEKCEQLEEIGDDFCRGASLRVIRFPRSLKSIGNGFMAHVVAAPSAKADAPPLTIDLSVCPALEKIGTGFAEGCTATAVHFPGSLGAIPDSCCVDMTGLTSVTVGSANLDGTLNMTAHLNTLGDNFLLRAKALTELDLESFGAVVAIGNNFARGSALRRVVMPATLRTLGSGFCADTRDLETVDLTAAKALETIGDDFCASSGVATVRLPEDLQRIGANFLARTKTVKEIDLSHLRGAVTIGDGFLLSSGIERLRVPKSLRETPKGFCQGTTGIEDLDLSMCRDLKYVRSNFAAESGIKTLKLPPRILSIDSGFMMRAFRIKDLDLSVLTGAKRLVIGDDFLKMSSVTVLIVPSVPLTIGNFFCSKCAALEELDLSVVEALHVRDGFLLGSGVKTLHVPPALHAVGDDFCAETTNLETIDLSKCVSISTIGEYFGRSSKVVRVLLPQPQVLPNLEGAGNRSSFRGTHQRPRLQQIPDGFLKGAKALDTVELPPTIVTIGDEFCANIGSDAFASVDLSQCSELVRIGSKFVINSANVSKIILPASIQEIGPQFAAGTKKLRDLSLEQCIALRTVGPKFGSGANLDTVRFPGCVRSLAQDVCDGCPSSCIARIGLDTLRTYVDSLNVDRNRATELELVRKLLRVLQRDEDQRTVAQRLLERGDVQLFLNVFDPMKEEVAAKLRNVGGTRQHLPALPIGSFLVLDTAAPDFGLTLAHWAVVLFPELLKKMHLSTDIVAAQTARGYSVLHYAVMHGADSGTIKALLAATSPTIARRIGTGYHSALPFTPLHLAFAYRNFEAAAELLDADGGYRGDPSEIVDNPNIVTFPVDVYDLALMEWGRARHEEHQHADKKDQESATASPALATACMALSAVAAALQALQSNVQRRPLSRLRSISTSTDEVDASPAPGLRNAAFDRGDDNAPLELGQDRPDAAAAGAGYEGPAIDASELEELNFTGTYINLDGLDLWNNTLVALGNEVATNSAPTQHEFCTNSATAFQHDNRSIALSTIPTEAPAVDTLHAPAAATEPQRDATAATLPLPPTAPGLETPADPPLPLALPSVTSEYFASKRSVHVSAVAWHLAHYPESRLPPPQEIADIDELSDVVADPGGLPREVRSALRDGRGAAQQIPRHGVYCHRLIITAAMVSSAAAAVANKVEDFFKPFKDSDPLAVAEVSLLLKQLRDTASATNALASAASARVASRRSEGDPQAIAKAEAHTLRQAANATLMEITEATDIDVLIAAVQRLCVDGIALSLGHATNAQQVEYRLRRFDGQTRFYTRRRGVKDKTEQELDVELGQAVLPIARSPSGLLQQLASSLQEIVALSSEACHTADAAILTSASYHADEARECQFLIEVMENGPFKDKLIDKFDAIVPVSTVWPSFAFFTLFIIYLLGSPLIFDIPKCAEVPAVVEYELKNCLGRFSGGVATYRGLRLMNRTDLDPGVSKWTCPVNLTQAIIESVTTRPNKEKNFSYDLVEVNDLPSWPQVTDETWYFPHALRFSTNVIYRGLDPEGRVWRYWVATEVNGGWPSEYRFWTDTQKAQTRQFTRGVNNRNYRHRVVPEYFGRRSEGWCIAVWIASALCCIALLCDCAVVFRLVAHALFPHRYPGNPVMLLPPSLADVALRCALLVVEGLVVCYNVVWIAGFTALISSRTGANAFADWDTGEKFVRAGSSLKLSTLLAAVPGLAFARKVPKPNQFHITNAVAAACLLAYLVVIVEKAPVFRLEEVTKALSVDLLVGMNAVGPLVILAGFGATLFARRSNTIAKKTRQWHYYLLTLRRKEHATKAAELASATDALAEPEVQSVATPSISPSSDSSESRRRRHKVTAVHVPGSKDEDDLVLRRVHHNAVELASFAANAANRFRPPYGFWFSMQWMTIMVACLFQLTLYGTCLYVFIAPALIDVPYGAVDRPEALAQVVTTAVGK
jgi:hypothetical protein